MLVLRHVIYFGTDNSHAIIQSWFMPRYKGGSKWCLYVYLVVSGLPRVCAFNTILISVNE